MMSLSTEIENMLSNEDRKYIVSEYLRTIHHISSKEYQKRVWIRGEGPECDDFDETVNYFFGEIDSILNEYKEFGITENQFHVLKSFRDKFEVFADKNNWPSEFIDTPEWNEITEMAKEVLKAFNYDKTRAH